MFIGGIKILERIINFGKVENVTLIGGGDLMLFAAREFLKNGFNVSAILSQRHANESLPIAKTPLSDVFKKLKATITILNEIDDYTKYKNLREYKQKGLALCFGPAWIFPESFIKSFEFGMLNFNGIPVPKYLGGAHYSWQILNEDKSGGCVLQEITKKVDRGSIIRAHYFNHLQNTRTPQDYFVSNYYEGCLFIKQFIEDVLQSKPMDRIEYERLECERLFFPRLLSDRNGWINWLWNAQEIERFCCAFDEPYSGAVTNYNEAEVRLFKVFMENDDGEALHPFCAGLVLRKWRGKIWVGAKGGILRVEKISSLGEDNIISTIKEGQRFLSPYEKINESITYVPRFSGLGIES